MQPPFWEGMVLGAIHGFAEFLPISSDGHAALAKLLFGVSSSGRALEALLPLATLLATLVMLWPRVRAAVADGAAAVLRPSLFSTTAGARDALVMILASIPSAAVGFALRHAVARWTDSPLLIGLGFLGTGALLIISRFAKLGQSDQPGIVGAVLLGVAQGVAVLPGVSRIAATITLALLLGVRRERAFEVSLLISLPALLGAALLEVPGAIAAGAPIGPAAAAALLAFIVGMLAVRLLKWTVIAGSFSWFAAWVVPVSLATLALARAWPHG
jgi:undecaprenyl-diphosphatase